MNTASERKEIIGREGNTEVEWNLKWWMCTRVKCSMRSILIDFHHHPTPYPSSPPHFVLCLLANAIEISFKATYQFHCLHVDEMKCALDKEINDWQVYSMEEGKHLLVVPSYSPVDVTDEDQLIEMLEHFWRSLSQFCEIDFRLQSNWNAIDFLPLLVYANWNSEGN